MVSVFELSSCLLASSALFLLAASPCAHAAPFSSWAGKRSAPPSGLLHRPATQDLAQLIHDLRELYMLQGGTSPPGMEAADYAEETAMDDEQMEKRAPFSSWAGKRAPFSSWAGKRAPFSSWAGKRAPFSSWAGKRSAPASYDEVMDASEEGKLRLKRSSDESEEFSRDARSGNSFSAWGGKRVPLLRFTRNAPVAAPSANQLVPVSRLRPQRAAFSAWGG